MCCAVVCSALSLEQTKQQNNVTSDLIFSLLPQLLRLRLRLLMTLSSLLALSLTTDTSSDNNKWHQIAQSTSAACLHCAGRGRRHSKWQVYWKFYWRQSSKIFNKWEFKIQINTKSTCEIWHKTRNNKNVYVGVSAFVNKCIINKLIVWLEQVSDFWDFNVDRPSLQLKAIKVAKKIIFKNNNFIFTENMTNLILTLLQLRYLLFFLVFLIPTRT